MNILIDYIKNLGYYYNQYLDLFIKSLNIKDDGIELLIKIIDNKETNEFKIITGKMFMDDGNFVQNEYLYRKNKKGLLTDKIISSVINNLNQKEIYDDYENYKIITWDTVKIAKLCGWKLCDCWERHNYDVQFNKRDDICCFVSFTNQKYNITTEIEDGIYKVKILNNYNKNSNNSDGEINDSTDEDLSDEYSMSTSEKFNELLQFLLEKYKVV